MNNPTKCSTKLLEEHIKELEDAYEPEEYFELLDTHIDVPADVQIAKDLTKLEVDIPEKPKSLYKPPKESLIEKKKRRTFVDIEYKMDFSPAAVDYAQPEQDWSESDSYLKGEILDLAYQLCKICP